MWNRWCSTVVAVVVVVVLLGVSIAASACVGARPLAMGGAFVGLADDVNATYWNPAGLTQVSGIEATWMHTSTNRDEINYQDYAAVAGPIGRTGAVGVSWVKSNVVLGVDDEGLLVDGQDWYWASLAAKLGDNFGLGVNIKEIRNSLPGLDTEMGFDIGLHGKVGEDWSLGLLVQNVNTPAIKVDGVPAVAWARNWRPGVAYRADDSSVASLELYDATDEVDRAWRIGYEKVLKQGWAVRVGYYGLGSDLGDAVTFGFGKRDAGKPGDEVSFADLDVAVMIGDIDTILASVSFGL